MNYVTAAAAIAFASELVFHLPFDRVVSFSIATARKSVAVIQSPRISDDWKARAVLRYSVLLLIATLELALMCGAVLGIVVLAGLVGRFFGQDLFRFLASWPGLCTATGVSVAHIAVRRRRC
jgi:hypothetical protein